MHFNSNLVSPIVTSHNMFVFLDPSVCICFTLPSARVALPSARVVLPSACVVSLCHQLEDSAIRSCCSSISPCSNSKSTAAANIRNRIRFVYSLCHLARFPQAIVFLNFQLMISFSFLSTVARIRYIVFAFRLDEKFWPKCCHPAPGRWLNP